MERRVAARLAPGSAVRLSRSGRGRARSEPLVSRLSRRATRVAMATALAGLVALPVAGEAGQLLLSWTDNSGGTAGVEIERRLAAEPAFTQIASVAPGATTYTDAAVASGVTYCYRVRAFSESGEESGYSAEACGSVVDAFTVAVSRAGAGSGSVSSSPAGIGCGPDCSESYPSGTVVTLQAQATTGSVFGGWSGGGCAGTGSCVVAGNGSVTV